MSAPNGQVISTLNYLVPASGTTHAYVVSQSLSAVPVNVNFDSLEIDQQSFTPSGCFIDNTQGTGPVNILINELSYNIVCAPGQVMAAQYPAPVSQSAAITGLGQATIIFVDFPVIPFSFAAGGGGSTVSIANGADVAEGATTDAVATSDTGTATLIALTKRLLQKEGLGKLPFGATQVAVQSGNSPNAAINISLPAAAGKTTYITHLMVSGGGATAASLSSVIVANMLGGTYGLNFGVPAGITVGLPPIVITFDPPMPATAVNTALNITVAAFGAGNVAASASAQGYQL